MPMDANLIIVTFADIGNQLGVSAAEFVKSTALYHFRRSFLVDPYKSWYLLDPDGKPEGVFFYREALATICLPYRERLFVGSSMGATAALMFSDIATHTLAFAPQVDLYYERKYGTPRRKRQARIIDNDLADLCRDTIVKNSLVSSYTICTGLNPVDLYHASLLKNRSAHIIYGTTKHNIPAYLKTNNMLKQLLDWSVLNASTIC